MKSINDPVEFADLLDRLNISNAAEAAKVEAELEIDLETAREGTRFWARNYKQVGR